jgi:hypothetical protein
VQARLRENELLRLHRPKFNTMNTRPEAYGFIGLLGTPDGIELWLTTDSSSSEALYGAFKGQRLIGYAALLRTLLVALTGAWVPDQFPLRLLSTRPPRRFRFSCRGRHPETSGQALLCGLQRYLEGESAEMIDLLRAHVPSAEVLPPFWRQLQESDLQAIDDFFERGPKRNRCLKELHGIEDRLIAPARLDDLLVTHSAARQRRSATPSAAPAGSCQPPSEIGATSR